VKSHRSGSNSLLSSDNMFKHSIKVVPVFTCLMLSFLCVVIAFFNTTSLPTSVQLFVRAAETSREYILMASNNYGRYSNMRMAFILSGAFAMYTNRTFLYTLPLNCQPQVTWDELLDVRHLPFPAFAAEPKHILGCHRHIQGHMLVNHNPVSCHSQYAIPQPDPQRYINSFLRWLPIFSPNGTKWSMEQAARKIASSHCAGIMCPWDMFETDGAVLSTMATIERHVRPSSAIDDVVQSFARQNGIFDTMGVIRPFVGIHLRLTDIGGQGSEQGCKINMTEVIGHAERLGKELNSSIFALATDSKDSTCAKSIISRFSPVMVFSNAWADSSCQEAVFVQEVLAKSTAFIGHKGSTFSIAIESMRQHRYHARVPGIYVGNGGA
jgi:hypothetical protein